MRAFTWTRWATCALALAICVPAALAESKSKSTKSLATCTSFDQEDKDDDTVEFTIHNTCSIPISCAVTWRLVCAPDSKSRRVTHRGAAKLSFTAGTSQSTEASASVCKDASWKLDSVNWSCEPSKD